MFLKRARGGKESGSHKMASGEDAGSLVNADRSTRKPGYQSEIVVDHLMKETR